MQIEATHETDIVCKDLIGESYEAAYALFPNGGWFSGLPKVWEKIEVVLGRKGALDLCTTGAEDREGEDILEEVFEGACQIADEEGKVTSPAEYVDYKALWERVCAVIGVKV